VVGGLADPDPTAPPSQNLDPGAEGDDDTSGVKNDDTSGVKNDDNESGVATTPRKRQFGNRLFERQHSKRWKTVESKDATSGGPEKDATSGAPEKDATSAADPDPKPKANDDAA
jgi:hypothetical protein